MHAESRVRAGLVALVVAVAFFGVPPARGAPSPPMYVAVPLGSLGGVQSEGRAINRNGDTTGFAFVHGDAAYHAFLAIPERMLDLGSPTGGSSVGTAINVDDDVVLNSSVVTPPPPFGQPLTTWYAFRFANGSMQAVDADSPAMVTGINDAGSISGFTVLGAFKGLSPPYMPIPDLGVSGGINASGAVVGTTVPLGTASVEHAAIVDPAGVLHDLGSVGTWSSRGSAINDHGDATGALFGRDPVTGIEHSHALLYTAGHLADLGGLDANYVDTRGEGINNNDVVVGTATDPATIRNRAFIYVDGRMYDLTSRVVSGLGEAVLFYATGVNDAGQIIGTGCGAIGTCQAYRLDPVTSIPPPPPPVPMIEYYEAAFDHYFMTSLPNEIEALDAGTFPGWARTGQSFAVYPSATPGAERVCRFFNDQIVPSSHFYSADPNECLFTQNQPGWTWQLEGIVAYVAVPDLAGSCPADSVPVYRLYNNAKGGAPNHRYTASDTVRAQMLAQGWVAEGYGEGVVMCAPSR